MADEPKREPPKEGGSYVRRNGKLELVARTAPLGQEAGLTGEAKVASPEAPRRGATEK